MLGISRSKYESE